MIRFMTFLAVALNVNFAAAAATKPLKISPIGNLKAPVKDTLTRNLDAEPESFNPLSSTDLVSTWVYAYVLDSLLNQNPDTYEFEQGLAESYEVSKDALSITFHLRKDAKFSDGSPVTSEDVKFSIDYPKDLAYKAAAKMPYFEDVDHVETPDPQTAIVKMKRRYYMNLLNLASNPIVSKKIYQDAKKEFGDSPLYGSGPYKVEAYNRGKNIMLVRNPLWWGYSVPALAGANKFERINFRFIKDENLAVEMVKKGDIDYLEPIRAETFVKKAVGEPFGTKIAKVQVENKRPKSYGFVAWNEKNPIFKDKAVRTALSQLFNRKELIAKFAYNMSVEGKGPYSFNSPYLSPDAKAVGYDPEAAKALLKKAGWEDKQKNGVLQKEIDGKTVEFRFDLLLPNREVEKYFTLYKEDLRKAGIDMGIKNIKWSSFIKLLDEQKFDAVTLSWGGGSLEDDLKQIWHTDSAKPGGSNFISYSNKEVDKLIDEARQEMNKDKRKVLWRKISKLIADDQPYTFMFNPKFDLYFLNKRIASDKPTFTYALPYMYFYSAP